jgi:hypothetical protein
MMNNITEQVVALATQTRADEYNRLIEDIKDAEDYHNRLVHQFYDHIYMLEKDVAEREACIIENNDLNETLYAYIKMPSERMVRGWWASYQAEADDIDEDVGLERMVRLTDTFYLKMPHLFDTLWDLYNDKKWDHLNKQLI